MGFIKTRFLRELEDGTLIAATLGYGVAEAGEEVRVYNRSSRETYEEYYVSEVVTECIQDLPQTLLDKMDVASTDDLVASLTRAFRTGLGPGIVVTVYDISPDPIEVSNLSEEEIGEVDVEDYDWGLDYADEVED